MIGFQEIIVFILVSAAIVITGRLFFRQFTVGEKEFEKCAGCALNKMKPQENVNIKSEPTHTNSSHVKHGSIAEKLK